MVRRPRRMRARKVEYELKESRFIWMNEEGWTFAFSSRLHLEKFIGGLEKANEAVETRLRRIVPNIQYNTDRLAEIYWYQKTETRGWCILDEKGWEIWPENLALSGEIKTARL